MERKQWYDESVRLDVDVPRKVLFAGNSALGTICPYGVPKAESDDT